MPNIASVLKEEITRLARKELRSETESLKKASASYRSEIAALKRRVTTLEQQLARLGKKTARNVEAPADPEVASRVRYSAKGLRTQRQRLGLSAADLATLLGVSQQTIYNWEAETTRPRGPQITAIAALRTLGKKAVATRLEELAAAAQGAPTA